jgi:hypothetical protein
MIHYTKKLLRNVNDLIEYTKHLITQYPDKISLKISLESLEEQRKQLEAELCSATRTLR